MPVAYKALEKGGKTTEAKEAEIAYNDAKCIAEHAIWLAEATKEEFATICPDGADVFRITKQMDHTNQDVIGENCVCNDADELALTDEDKLKAWVEHYARLLNVEFEWPSNELAEVPQLAALSQCVCDPDPQSTQQDEMQQGYRPFWHHRRDAESCW